MAQAAAAARREDYAEDHDTRHVSSFETDTDAERARRKALLGKALAAVHPSRIDVLVLHDLDGVSMPDIVAEIRGWRSVSPVRASLSQ